jgi:hypothetical protein
MALEAEFRKFLIEAHTDRNAALPERWNTNHKPGDHWTEPVEDTPYKYKKKIGPYWVLCEEYDWPGCWVPATGTKSYGIIIDGKEYEFSHRLGRKYLRQLNTVEDLKRPGHEELVDTPEDYFKRRDDGDKPGQESPAASVASVKMVFKLAAGEIDDRFSELLKERIQTISSLKVEKYIQTTKDVVGFRAIAPEAGTGGILVQPYNSNRGGCYWPITSSKNPKIQEEVKAAMLEAYDEICQKIEQIEADYTERYRQLFEINKAFVQVAGVKAGLYLTCFDGRSGVIQEIKKSIKKSDLKDSFFDRLHAPAYLIALSKPVSLSDKDLAVAIHNQEAIDGVEVKGQVGTDGDGLDSLWFNLQVLLGRKQAPDPKKELEKEELRKTRVKQLIDSKIIQKAKEVAEFLNPGNPRVYISGGDDCWDYIRFYATTDEDWRCSLGKCTVTFVAFSKNKRCGIIENVDRYQIDLDVSLVSSDKKRAEAIEAKLREVFPEFEFRGDFDDIYGKSYLNFESNRIVVPISNL